GADQRQPRFRRQAHALSSTRRGASPPFRPSSHACGVLLRASPQQQDCAGEAGARTRIAAASWRSSGARSHVSRTMSQRMEFRYVVCDVFTDTPLAGNQLAVFTDARLVPEQLLQPIAREMNYSETVFVYPAKAGGHARIRIFTPFNELPFAGHPVLGSAFVLAAPLQLPTIVLETGI